MANFESVAQTQPLHSRFVFDVTGMRAGLWWIPKIQDTKHEQKI